jgi:hypothetical protein
MSCFHICGHSQCRQRYPAHFVRYEWFHDMFKYTRVLTNGKLHKAPPPLPTPPTNTVCCITPTDQYLIMP